MFCYFLLLSLMVDLAYGSEPSISDRIESLYPAYDAIHDAVWSQPKLVFKIRQAFFPVINYRYWQVDGAEITVEPLYKDTPEMRTSTLNRTL